MQGTDFWNKLNLQRCKALIIVVLCALASQSHAQRTKFADKNNPNYDDRKLTYGFLIGLHTSTYQIKYEDEFLTPPYENLHSIVPRWKQGFSLGFIVNYRLNEVLDFRLTPKVAFYEHELNYLYTDNTPSQTKLVETTMVELPILLKYKSQRRGNVRMYVIGGIKPGIQASGQKEVENTITVEVNTSNISLETGIGLDLYFPLFKFSPEIRFSRGLMDVLTNRNNPFGEPLRRVNTNTISVYFLFQ